MTALTEHTPAVKDDADWLPPSQQSASTIDITTLGSNEWDAHSREHVKFIQTLNSELFTKIVLPNGDDSLNVTGCSKHLNGPTVPKNNPQLDHEPIPNQQPPKISCLPQLKCSHTRSSPNWTDIGKVSHADACNSQTITDTTLSRALPRPHSITTEINKQMIQRIYSSLKKLRVLFRQLLHLASLHAPTPHSPGDSGKNLTHPTMTQHTQVCPQTPLRSPVITWLPTYSTMHKTETYPTALASPWHPPHLNCPNCLHQATHQNPHQKHVRFKTTTLCLPGNLYWNQEARHLP